jgi:hypothetical protein
VAPPPPPDGYALRYANTDAMKGWEELCQQAPANTRKAYEVIESDPCPTPPTTRHHQLKGALSTDVHGGQTLPQWQYEVTSGARIWYLVDHAARTCWMKHAGTRHPKQTE